VDMNLAFSMIKPWI